MQKRPTITITDNAAKRINYLLQNTDEKPIGVKVAIKTKGCSGLAYDISYAKEIGKFDEVVLYPSDATDGQEQFKVIIDAGAVMHVIGSKMDFVETTLQSNFTFNNPNAKGHCGCGESFYTS